MNGWVKLHRGIMDKPIWTESTSDQKVILMALLMLANYEEKQWTWGGREYSLQPGQFVTSVASLSQRCGKGVTASKIRTALKRFEEYGFLTSETTNQNQVITIVNWGFYQKNDGQMTNVFANERRAVNEQIATTKKERTKNKRKRARLNEFTLDLTKGEAI
ncbi:hypothetical protein [Sporosarcina sp. UB5]|uniref:hypothetical protein n=1 Tax=Sporosarcina sp. UB5 TaxID=3047463 RepID=UPI003D78ED20